MYCVHTNIRYAVYIQYVTRECRISLSSKPFLSDAGVLAILSTSAGSHGNPLLSSLSSVSIAHIPPLSLPTVSMVSQQSPYFGNRPPSYGLPSFPSAGISQPFQCRPIHVGVPLCAPPAASAPSALAGPALFSANLDQTRVVHDSREGSSFTAPADAAQRQADANSHPPGFDMRHNSVSIQSQSDFGRHNNDSMPRFAYPSAQNLLSESHHQSVYPQLQHQNSFQPHQHSYTLQHFHSQYQQAAYTHPSPNLSAQHHSNFYNQQKMPFQGITPQEQLHRQLLPVPRPSYIQGCDVKGTAIGVPIGKPVYMENPYSIASPTYPLGAAMMGALPQASVNTVMISQACQEKNSQMNFLERNTCLGGSQYPNTHRSNLVHSSDSKPHTVHPYANCANGYAISSCNPGIEIYASVSVPSDGQRNSQKQADSDEICKHSNVSAIDQNQLIWHGEHSHSVGEHFCAPGKSDGQNLTAKLQESVANERQHSNIRRNNHNSEMPVKPNRNQHFQRRNQNHYSKNVHDKFQGSNENKHRERQFNKGMGRRPINNRMHQLMRCESCDRTFGNRGDFDSHFRQHVKCDEEGCAFEASGKIVKEHKVMQHGKTNPPTTAIGRKALALRLVEDEGEVRRWREERKRNYPTTANILRKAEQKKNRQAAGVSLDEEMQMRCQQMSKVLARQKELGFQVAEIPSKYLASYNSKEQRFGRNLEHGEKSGQEKANKRPYSIAEPEDESHRVEKHQNKESLPRQKQRRQHFSSNAMSICRQPTLLSKLLERDIEMENSYLLQCCRFIVNNGFLKSLPLKHFQWIEAGSASMNGTTADGMKLNEHYSDKSESIEPPQILGDNDSGAHNTE